MKRVIKFNGLRVIIYDPMPDWWYLLGAIAVVMLFVVFNAVNSIH